jgi:hypothetical protein
MLPIKVGGIMISRHPQIQVQQYLLDGLFIFYKGYDAHEAIALGA